MTINAKKSLGQNFLRSEKALRQIIEAAQLTFSDTVLEIGPGEGVLTERLLDSGATVIAIEKDDRLIPILQEKFASFVATEKFILIHDDITNLSLETLTHPVTGTILLSQQQFKVVANIPYYITGLLFPLILSGRVQPSLAVFLVQKEVAERIVARDKKESILSMSIKVYGKPKLIDKVPRGAFVPAPNVDSAIIQITDISKDFFKTMEEKDFFTVLKKGFAHKRKFLKGNLDISEEILEKAGLPSTVRAEDITLEQWKTLAALL